jgi:TPR repeat protein
MSRGRGPVETVLARRIVLGLCLCLAPVSLAGCGRSTNPSAAPGKPLGAPAPPTGGLTSPAPAGSATPGNGPGHPRHDPYPFKRVVLVAIGINQYEKLRGSSDLLFARADAESFAELAGRLYGYEVVLLTGPKATKREIELTLRSLGRELGQEDALVVFFAGHGQLIPRPAGDEAGYLIPCDADLDLNDKSDPDRWESQALNMQYLSDVIEGMNARHVLFIADACCSGFMTRRGTLDRADLKTFLFDRSRTILAATTKRQAAREDREARHGFFTAALLEELRKDDAASVEDLYLPVLKSVAAKTNGVMTPQLGHVGDGDGMFVFIPKSIPVAQIDSDLNGRTLEDSPARGLSAVQARGRQRLARRTTEDQMLEAFAAPDYKFGVLAEDEKTRWERLFGRFRENAGLGDVWAMAALHVCYAKGLGIEKNPEQAYFWARQLDRFRKPAGVGRYFLGRCYLLGLGVPPNEAAALKLYQESADRGYLLGELALAENVMRRQPTAEQVTQAKGALEKGTAANIADAAYNLAALYANGKYPGVAQDVPRAVKLYEKAAASGSVSSMFVVYEFYRADSPGFPGKNLKLAEHNLRKAAESGYAPAQLMLARELLHKPGIRQHLGLPENAGEAVRWVRLAAEQALPNAQVMLCNMYTQGWGVEANAEEARKWCEAAAAQNDANAHYIRGDWYRTGRVYGQQDLVKAADCYRKASDLGHAEASYAAAKLYELREQQAGTLHRGYTPEVLHFWTRSARLEVKDAKEQLDGSFFWRMGVRNESGDHEQVWKTFADRYPDSAKDLIQILDLDPDEPWTRQKRKPKAKPEPK